MSLRFAGLTASLCFSSAAALASEKPVAKSAVPAAVMQMVTTSYPSAKVIETVSETQDNRKLYEVRIQVGTARVDLRIDASGKLVAQEHPMDPKTSPVAVTNAALAPPYQDWAIQKVEKVDNLETPAQSGYEVTIQKDGRKREMLLAPDGKLLNIEDADDQK